MKRRDHLVASTVAGRTHTAAVCLQDHAWPVTMTTIQARNAAGSVLHNTFTPDVPSCPTCGEEWDHTDPARQEQT